MDATHIQVMASQTGGWYYFGNLSMYCTTQQLYSGLTKPRHQYRYLLTRAFHVRSCARVSASRLLRDSQSAHTCLRRRAFSSRFEEPPTPLGTTWGPRRSANSNLSRANRALYDSFLGVHLGSVALRETPMRIANDSTTVMCRTERA